MRTFLLTLALFFGCYHLAAQQPKLVPVEVTAEELGITAWQFEDTLYVACNPVQATQWVVLLDLKKGYRVHGSKPLNNGLITLERSSMYLPPSIQNGEYTASLQLYVFPYLLYAKFPVTINR